MCGIFGSWGIGDEAAVERGLDLIRHRGPDGRGLIGIGEAIHGHVRLSLMDLSNASDQPFELDGAVLSWVGEIWNHAELRSELRRLGRTFRTTGDTEVLAASLLRWGPDALRRIDGMFSLAWSGPDGDWLARDRFGKVPAFALRSGRAFEWASERKAWGRRGGLASPLPPASRLCLRTGRIERWWSLPDRSDADPGDALALLRAGVAKRLAADAPVCVLASGGLDSSLILTLAAALRPDVVAFSAVLDRSSADSRWARRICSDLGVRLIEVEVPAPTARSLAEACRCVEIGSKVQCEIAAACLPLARAVRAEGFKACLSGEAADELFGGYGNSCIRAASLDDAGWIAHRRGLLAKMARGNFQRCNKAFMAAGVECRLPFMERELVELALSLGKRDCPPGKGLLKRAAAGIVPAAILRRPKETFQGGSGMSAAASSVVADPERFYRSEIRKAFGRLIMD